jgi:hypothetical protein
VNEVNGIWQAAIDLSGKGTLRVGSAKVNSVSCSSAGNCSAGGDYASAISGGSEQEQAFVAKEVGGRWQSVIEVPGTSSLNVNFASEVTSISCGSVESCIAGGTYLDGSEHTQVFEVRELNGVWQSAIEVPGVAPLNDGGAATFSTVSCVSTNACSAGGSYTHGSRVQAFVVNEGR